MREPTQEEIDRAKARAREQTGSDAVELYEFPHIGDAGACVIYRDLTGPEYGRYLDTSMRSDQDAAEGAWMDVVLWTSLGRPRDFLNNFPGAAVELGRVLDENAGLTQASDKIAEKLSAATSGDLLERAGVPTETAKELLDRFHEPGQLTLVLFPKLGESFILKTPKGLFAAAQARIATAQRNKQGYRAAAIASVEGIIVWSKNAPADVWKRWPALPGGALLSIFLELGGSSATAGARKRL